MADPFVLAVTEGEPHLSISNSVNPITGDFYLGRNDIVILGVEPLHIPSLYVSGDGRAPYKGKVGWEILPHQKLIWFTCKQDKIDQVIVAEKNGSRLKFEHTIDNEYHIDLKKHGPGISNDAKGNLSARTNLRNSYVVKKPPKRMTYHLGDGTERRYKFRTVSEDIYDKYRLYLLKWEKLPNGNRIYYEYDSHDRPNLIKTTNPDGTKIYAWAKFHYAGKPHVNPNFSLETSDGRHLHYEFQASQYSVSDKIYGGTTHVDVYLLSKMTRNFGPAEFFSWGPGQKEDGPRMLEASLPGRHYLSPAYYYHHDNDVGGVNIHLGKKDCRQNRVKILSSPVGFDDKPVITHRFFYHPNKKKSNSYESHCKTDIYDVYNNLTTIQANPFCRPTETHWYSHQEGAQLLVRSEKTFWGVQDIEVGNLRAKLFLDHGQGSFAKIYEYDAFGNVLSEKFCGNLSGEASPCSRLQIPSSTPSKEYQLYINDRTGLDLLVANKPPHRHSNWIHYFHRIGVGLYADHETLYDSQPPKEVYRLIKCHQNEATFRLETNISPQIHPAVGAEISETTYGYTANHLMAWKKEPAGLVTRFTYRGSTDLLASRFTYDQEKILTREFFEYDSDHILLRHIEDNGSGLTLQDLSGVTQRKIKAIFPKKIPPHNGLPEIIEERYLDFNSGNENLLRKTVLAYNGRGDVTTQDIYDSNEQFRYRLTYDYDERGRLISETNRLGQTQSYSYDEYGNKTVIRDYSVRVTTYNTFDFAGRLIQVIEEGDDGNRLVLHHKYNLKNQKISTTDSRGNETHYTYDPFDNLLETKLPSSHLLKATYDGFGRQLSSTDENGHTTFRTYSARGKPVSILHPDGTQENYTYNLDGTLKTHIDQQGTAIAHRYDALGRLIQKNIFLPSGELLSSESWNYGSYQLLSKKDAAGIETSYEYDGAGRKIAEICQDERIEYIYDSLGRISKTRCGPRIHAQEYDLEDRIVEERVEDLNGAILTQTRYAYDRAGNKSEITQWTSTGPSTEMTLFDAFKRPLRHVDALGHITVTSYDDHFQHLGQEVLQKTTTDPEGTRLIETYDVLGRVVVLEMKNPSNDLLHQENYTYDGVGNKIRQETHVITPHSSPKTIVTLWEYGSLKRLLMLTEAYGTPEQRTTRYAYTVKGLLQQIQKPDGKTLSYTYDALNRLQQLFSSDRSCYYIFYYNALHQPIFIDDLVQNTRTTRTYDHHSRLISETLGNGLMLSSSYDILGRKTALQLPDKSYIAYTFDAASLRDITRYSSSGSPLYAHRYTCFDPSGRLLEQNLIYNLGTQVFDIDPIGRTTSTASPYFNSTLTAFDGRGNLQAFHQDGQSYRFSYDDLSQLLAENNHQYAHDSNHNRFVKDGKISTVNALNQLDHFTYDKNGNPLSDGKYSYTYDALDRLTSVLSSTHYARFTYDAFHRRMSKKLYVKKNGQWMEEPYLRYLYDGDNDIGAADEDGSLIELRVLGIGKGAEIGASVAIELRNEVYAPIHDLRGNIVKLISKTGQATESYSYTAFGEETLSTSYNPWRFCSKRTESEFNLVYFGRRFYSPSLGRWLNPDPQGFTDGMNLYAYVHNNPLLKLDLYGLESIGYNIHISVSLTTCLQMANLFTSCAGMGLAAVGKHTLPGVLGDMTHALGNSIAGLDYTRPSSQVLRVGWRHAGDSVALTGVNGMLNSMEDAFNLGQKISESHGDVPVSMIYNSSHGFLSDILEVFLDATGIGSRPAHLLANQWRLTLQTFHNKGIYSGEIYHYAHSQGGSITENALWMLTPEERSHIKVFTFGSSALFSKELAGSVIHYVSRQDGVPMLDALRYMKALFSQSSHVQFIGNGFGLPEHSWKSASYSGMIDKRGQIFKDKFFKN